MENLLLDTSQVKRPGLLVLVAGIGTTIVTLVLLYILKTAYPESNLMNLWGNYVIPAGAIFVGLVAGSGYGIASWLTGTKITGRLLVLVVLLQIAAYFSAQYVEYVIFRAALPDALDFSFWAYFDAVTRAFNWSDNGKPGEPFGAWGYAMRALEIAGFSLGGIVAPAILFAVPYCNRCQAYMRRRELGLLPAGVLPKKVKKTDTVAQHAYQQEQQEALKRGLELVEQLFQMVQTGNAEAFVNLLKEHAAQKKAISKLTSRIGVKLQHCRRCGSGNVVAQLVSGEGQNVSTNVIGQCKADSAFVQNIWLCSRPR